LGAKPNIVTDASLQFFGRISASISHELKNVLAIFNENAGLLEDLTYMADQGKPIDPKRLEKMAGTFKKQIGRADDILKNMNRFAHTIDEPVTDVNLHEIIDLFLALTARFTIMQGYKLDPTAGRPGDDPHSPIFPAEPFVVVPGICNVRRRRRKKPSAGHGGNGRQCSNLLPTAVRSCSATAGDISICCGRGTARRAGR